MVKDNPEDSREQLALALRQLKWLLTGFELGGIRDWPVRSRDADKPEILPPSEEPLVLQEVTGLEPPSAMPERHGEPEAILAGILEELGDCKRCRLHSGRRHMVFADGTPHARLVFVGEGPGFDEDRQGLPFVGRAGRLLDKMIGALGLKREETYICNVVKCRPPENRTPEADEIKACSPFMLEQMEAIPTAVICALGMCAAQTLLHSTSSISKLRGRIHLWRGIPLVCTFHPAYLLRTPSGKAATWQDLLQVRQLLEEDAKALPRGKEIRS